MSAEHWEILNTSHVALRARSMLRIGARKYRASAFAVYSASSGFTVSRLLMPYIPSGEDTTFEGIQDAHKSIDPAPLVKDMPSDGENVERWARIMGAHNDHGSLSEELQKTVGQIMAAPGLSKADRNAYIEGLLNRTVGLTEEYRTDVRLLARCPPMEPFRRLSLDSLLVPPVTDGELSRSSEWLQHNPGAVEAVYAGDGERQGALLYMPDASRDQIPSLYDAEQPSSTKSALEVMQAAGYKAVAIALTEQGVPYDTEREKILDWG